MVLAQLVSNLQLLQVARPKQRIEESHDDYTYFLIESHDDYIYILMDAKVSSLGSDKKFFVTR